MEEIVRLLEDLRRRVANLEAQIRTPRWISWTPTVTQSGSVTVTVNEAKYCLVGKVCHVQAKLAVTGSGTGGQPVKVGGQPSAMQPAFTDYPIALGSYILENAGIASYNGVIFAYGSATDWRLNGDPMFALGSDDVLTFVGAYRVA